MGLSRMGRATTGTASVYERDGRYRIRLPRCVCGGKLVFIGTGLSVSQENYRKVQTVVWQIDADIANGNFDVTLERYQLRPKLELARPQTVPQIRDLWGRYADHMSGQVAATTWIKDYDRKFRNRLDKLAVQDFTQAAKVRAELLEAYSPDSARRTLEYLAAMGRWALSVGLVESNPYAGLSEGIRKYAKDTAEIDPFDPGELMAIFNAFRSHRSYSHYLPFVQFLALVGCRPGEAIALTWADVGDRSIRISKSYDGQLKILKGTKTDRPRNFPINGQLRELLLSVPSRGDLLFPAAKGGYLRLDKFTNQVWRGCTMGKKLYRGVLGPLVESGEVRRYRPPYNLRHTWITSMLESGLTVSQVAQLAGNSPEVVLKHYAGSTLRVEIPEIRVGV